MTNESVNCLQKRGETQSLFALQKNNTPDIGIQEAVVVSHNYYTGKICNVN